MDMGSGSEAPATEASQSEAPDHDVSGRYLPVLLVLFVGSGCAALIYELIWFQLLRQVIGSSAVSLGILLASFMGGLCLGSLAFPAYVPNRYQPLKVYALLELAIGAIGIGLLLFLPLVRMVYVAAVGYGFWGILLRAFVCLVFLLPPTIFMGATLPAVARWMETTRTGVSRLGFLYMANIVGAVAGTLAAGFWLLRVYDMFVATAFAVGLNVLVAGVALVIAVRTPFSPPDPEDAVVPPFAANRTVYIVIGISGLTALGAEVVWTRLLSLLFGATVYTFTIILAVFLIGLGIGSAVGSAMVRFVRSVPQALAWCQLLLVVAIPAGAFLITQELPFWYGNPDFDGTALRYIHDLLRGVVAMLPATLLWGASFPLALAAVAEPGQEPGHLVGRVYAANTVGAIAGSLVFSLLMVPAVGTQEAQQRLVLLSGIAALLMFGSAWFSRTRGERSAGAPVDETDERRGKIRALEWRPALALIGVIFATVVMIRALPAVPMGLVAYGRMVGEWDYVETYHYVGEGMNASVAVTDYAEENVRSFHVGGKVVASTRQVDMRIQRMLGHIPGLFHPEPKSVLVVGFGAGVTTGSFVLYPEVERIVVCEIEPLVPEAAGRYFAPQNYDVLNDPRVEVIFDDARHFIATTDEKFDVITSDPIHPWLNGSAALYSAEYYELVKESLNPGGVVAQWVPLYETSEAAVKSELATFMQAFPNGTVWSSDIFGTGYDVVMLGKVEPLVIDVMELGDRLDRNPMLRESLGEVDFWTVPELLGAYAGRGVDMAPWLEDAQLNRDRSLRLQYLAGLAIDSYRGDEIFAAMTEYRFYPADLFVAPTWIEYQLREMFQDPGIR